LRSIFTLIIFNYLVFEIALPLKKGGELNSSPFLRGIEGDLLEFLTLESNC
jgi:hypothetical protein